MLKISQKMGGLPAELQPVLKKCLGFSLGCHDRLKLCERFVALKF